MIKIRDAYRHMKDWICFSVNIQSCSEPVNPSAALWGCFCVLDINVYFNVAFRSCRLWWRSEIRVPWTHPMTSCRTSTTEECSCLVLTQIFYGSNKRCQTLVRLYHECFKAAFKVKWCNFLNWLLVLFWRCWVILSTLLTMTHHKPRYITTNSRPWNVVIEVFGQKYVDIWRPSADEERSCESLVEIGLNVNLNKKQQLVIIIIILFFFPYLCELQRATAQDCVRAFVSVKKSGFFFYEWQKTVFWCTITLWHCNKHTELQ